VRSASGAE
jgi:hypothetical protein